MKITRTKNLIAFAYVCAMAFISTFSYAADPAGKKTFTILHTNDMHSSFIGMGPASDYTPFSLNDDKTRGGYAQSGHLDRAANGGPQGSGACAGA